MSRYGKKRAMEAYETGRQEGLSRGSREYEEYDEYDEYDEDVLEIDEEEFLLFEASLEEEQQPVSAIFAGLVSIPFGMFLWGASTYYLGIQSGMVAILVGLISGLFVRIAGKGIHTYFGIVGAVSAILACVGGYLAMFYAMVMKANQLSFQTALSKYELGKIISYLATVLGPFELVFVAIAAFQGYRLSFRNVEASFEEWAESRALLR